MRANYAYADFVGKTFGRLVVLALKAARLRMALCRCECGTEKWIKCYRLKSGQTRSCGCLQREALGLASITHGYARGERGDRPAEYRIWCHIRARCSNPNERFYRYYGGRGIRVCERWQQSFQAFLDDMGRRPSSEHSIDRINNDGDYEPGNCRWATIAVQNNNTRQNKFVEFKGERLTIAQWASRLGVRPQSLGRRLRNGWPPQRALTEPMRRTTTQRDLDAETEQRLIDDPEGTRAWIEERLGGGA